MALFNRRKGEVTADGKPAYEPLLTRPIWEGAGRDAAFDGTEIIGDYAVLRWSTAYGPVLLGYSLTSGNGSVRALSSAVFRRYGKNAHQHVVAVVVGEAYWDNGPRLTALDLLPGPKRSAQYHPTFQQLNTLFGTKAPWFHSALRDRDAITAWRPGAAPALVPADDVELPAADLALLAVDEPDGSPVAQVASHLARTMRQRAHHAAERYLEHIAEDIQDDKHSDCHWLTLGALPRPRAHDDDLGELPELVRRAGWLELTERRDVLAYRVAHLVQRWDSGEDWPTGAAVEVRPTECATAAQWAATLTQAPEGRQPTVLDKLLLDEADEDAQLLYDPATDLPAVVRKGIHGDEEFPDNIVTAVPQRLPAHAELEAVTFSGEVVWVHSADGGLWLAPQLGDNGINYGYGGSGAVTLAQLLDRLLDDITAPTVDHHAPQPPAGLMKLVTTETETTVTYSRAQLLAARGR
ncbi:hypothetical protein [Streptomyces sp. CT34]|uniref:hypothetical protein n=1 Tax=Streptomyces sp. CT34 TaxID=1553907 RepID=UPI0005BA0F88|nr:hypothetical protein [Streptomyces sp. CT34]